jgi:hypothetical protein
MSAENDRKMFSPLRRGRAISPEAAVLASLGSHGAGATVNSLARQLIASGLAVGTLAPVAERVTELLGQLEGVGGVERIPDGRYRVVRTRQRAVHER